MQSPNWSTEILIVVATSHVAALWGNRKDVQNAMTFGYSATLPLMTTAGTTTQTTVVSSQKNLDQIHAENTENITHQMGDE